MTELAKGIDVYLEIGEKRTFAGALAWPGWCRSGRDEAGALQALHDYGPRYGRVLEGTQLEFAAPGDVSAFTVVERLEGNATTDFGAPGLPPASDSRPLGDAELRRYQELLKACWLTFERAVQAAAGKTLRKGPRGGGRDLEGVIQHVRGANAGYLKQLGWKFEKIEAEDLKEEVNRIRQAILDGLGASARGELPKRGPRGGVRWKARYFVRRVAWHVLDHAWEIEDRIE